MISGVYMQVLLVSVTTTFSRCFREYWDKYGTESVFRICQGMSWQQGCHQGFDTAP